MNHRHRILLPHGVADIRKRYTMADPEHPEVIDAHRRLRDAAYCGESELTLLTKSQARLLLLMLDDYARLTLTIDTTASAVRKLRELRAALRARRDAQP